MRLTTTALILALAAGTAGAAPPGAEACRGADHSAEAWQGCVEAVAGPCAARREGEGDGAWAACLSDRAEAWETELSERVRRLRAQGHEAGAPGALAKFLHERGQTCRDPDKVSALREAHGRAAADGAVLRCELLNNVHRAVLLDKIAREAGVAQK